MNALVRAVCGGASSPREWRRSLRTQRVALRSALRRSPLAAVGTRVGGAVLGQELIDTLSERLAQSIQNWNAPQVEPLELAERRRVAGGSVEAASAGQTTAALIREDATRERLEAAASSGTSVKRVWGTAIETAARAVAAAASSPEMRRTRIDETLAERGAEILRAVGLDVREAPAKRDAHRSSPLDAAIRRYRQSAVASETPSKNPAAPAAASVEAQRIPRIASATSGENAARSSVEAAPGEVALPNLITGQSGTATPDAPQRGWWSTRVDAIHSRVESFVPAAPRPGVARFEDDATDESAFADTLAEVLHRQARAYGVVVP